MTSSSESSQVKDFVFSPVCDYTLLHTVINQFNLYNKHYHVGSIISIDAFYHEDKNWRNQLANLNILSVDMETYMLYYNAMRTGNAALIVNMVSDNLVEAMK